MRQTEMEGLGLLESAVLRTKTQLSSLMSQWTIAMEWRRRTDLIIWEIVRGSLLGPDWSYLGGEGQGNVFELRQAEGVSQQIELCDESMQSSTVSVFHHEHCCILDGVNSSGESANLEDDDTDHGEEMICVDPLALSRVTSLDSVPHLRRAMISRERGRGG
jgi:hypothetical protein